MIYAPVIIPTLNRFEHFKICLESLEQCTGADKTDVFIGLDYPPSEKYKEGWEKIDNYLQGKEKQNHFNKLIVIRRDKNYGIQGEESNFNCLTREIFKINDRVIFSEDDNVFSPNFLDYINKGLEKFKDDQSVLAINGYRHFYPIKKDSNTFIRQNVDFSAWGYGVWRDRFKTWSSLDKNYFKNFLSLKKIFQIKRENGNHRAFNFWSYALSKEKIHMSDSPLSIYAKLENMDIIMPSEVSLVRNIGWDGSGVHCQRKDLQINHTNQPISDKSTFEFIGTGFENYERNMEIFKTYSYVKISNRLFWKRFLKCLIKMSMMKIRQKINK